MTTNDVNQRSDFDLVIRNLALVDTREPLPFVLNADTVRSINAAIVEVKGWHTTRLTPGYVKPGSSPRAGIIKFVNRASGEAAQLATGVDSPKAILVVSELAISPEDRAETERILKSDGVDHVLLFDEMLRLLVDVVNVEHHYAHSQTLHVLRLLKKFKMLK